MNISEEQYYEIIDRVTHEGDPRLILGPLQVIPSDVPKAWADLLAARDPGPAALALWDAMRKRLPRTCRALFERLQRVALLCTDDVPASLLYFFKGNDGLFAYRGRPPLDEEQLGQCRLPPDFSDFHRIHNGWVSFHSEDDGPAPNTDWVPPAVAWPDVAWKLRAGQSSPATWTTVFRDDGAFLIAYDTSVNPPQPVLCRNDGSMERMLDAWWMIDREVGEFLEELDPATPALPRTSAPSFEGPPVPEHRTARPAPGESASGFLPEGTVHCQSQEIWLEAAIAEAARPNSEQRERECYRNALQEWCESVSASGRASPGEVLDYFAIAQFLGDSSSAYFIATLPMSVWYDESLGAAQVHVLINVLVGNVELAQAGLENVVGLTFEAGAPPDPADEIIARLLESLLQHNASLFGEWRSKAVQQLVATTVRIPWRIRIVAFDAVAARSGP